jgi:chemotaxis methyl-accepting protein methylase
VATRVADLGVKGLAGCRALLEGGSEEGTRLDGLCRISISRFYGDRSVGRCPDLEILPRLAAQAQARGETRIRIWNARCASGEEPYTLALMFAFGAMPTHRTPEIVAFDADPVYSSARIAPVTQPPAYGTCRRTDAAHSSTQAASTVSGRDTGGQCDS